VIDILLSDDIVEAMGGRFKLTALIQRRLEEIIGGARPLVDRLTADGRALSNIEIVIEEIKQQKITVDWDASGLPAPGKTRR